MISHSQCFSNCSPCFLSAASTHFEPGLPSRHRGSGAKLPSSPWKEFVCSLRRKAPVSVGIDFFFPSQHCFMSSYH